MPKIINEINVFVSSPKDVIEEREQLEEVIKDINVVWSKSDVGIRLNLIKWESDVYPDMGTDAQDVINSQVSDYDIFIGIMWHRFGTPTERAGSGTAEEFEIAHQRHKEAPEKIKIMFYFNDSPIPPSEIDAEQLVLVNKFREKLGEKGGLYWVYNGPDEFDRKVRTHLQLQLPHWQKIIENETNGRVPVQTDDVPEEEDDEGFFELMEMGDTYAADLEIIMNRITIIGNDFQEEIEGITSNNSKIATQVEIRKTANEMADVMEKFASKMEQELPEFAETCNKTIDAYSRATLVSTDFYKDKGELNNVIISVNGAKKEFIAALGPINTFKTEVSQFPRITKPFNKAKKHTLTVMNSYSSEINSAINMMTDVEKALKEILSDLK